MWTLLSRRPGQIIRRVWQDQRVTPQAQAQALRALRQVSQPAGGGRQNDYYGVVLMMAIRWRVRFLGFDAEFIDFDLLKS